MGMVCVSGLVLNPIYEAMPLSCLHIYRQATSGDGDYGASYILCQIRVWLTSQLDEPTGFCHSIHQEKMRLHTHVARRLF